MLSNWLSPPGRWTRACRCEGPPAFCHNIASPSAVTGYYAIALE